MKNDLRRDRTKRLLRDAMTELLLEKPFDQITTIELVNRAGISRSGFYTHYTDKYDMVEFYQQILFNTIQYIFEKNRGNLRETLLEAYEFLDDNEIYAVLLSENGSQEIHKFILQKLTNLVEETVYPLLESRKVAGKAGDAYAKVFYANAIFGLTQTWIRRNRKETPTEMAELFVALVNTEFVDKSR